MAFRASSLNRVLKPAPYQSNVDLQTPQIPQQPPPRRRHALRTLIKLGLMTALIASATITAAASDARQSSLHDYQCGIVHGATWREPAGTPTNPSGNRYTVTARAGSRSICKLARAWVPRMTRKTGNPALEGLVGGGPPHYSCSVGWPEHHSSLHNGRCIKGNGGFGWVGVGPNGKPAGL